MGLRETFGKIGRAFGISSALFGAAACEKGETKAPETGHFIEPIKEQPKIAAKVRGTVDTALNQPQPTPTPLKVAPAPVQREVVNAPVQIPQIVKSTPKAWKKPEPVKPASRLPVSIPTGVDSDGNLIFDSIDDIEEITDFEKIATPKVKIAAKPKVTPPPLPKKPTATSDDTPKTPTVQITPPTVSPKNIQPPVVTSADTDSQTVPSTDGWDDQENKAEISAPEKPSVASSNKAISNTIPTPSAVDQEWDNIIDQWKTSEYKIEEEVLEDLTDEIVLLEDENKEEDIPEVDPSSVREIEEDKASDRSSIAQVTVAEESRRLPQNSSDSEVSEEPQITRVVKENRWLIGGLIVAMGALLLRRRKREDNEADKRVGEFIAELEKESSMRPKTQEELRLARMAEEQKKIAAEEAMERKKREEALKRFEEAKLKGSIEGRQEAATEILKYSGKYGAVPGGSGVYFVPKNAGVPSEATPNLPERGVKVSKIADSESKEAANNDIAVAK